MSGERPSAESLQRGMTVEIEQTNSDSDNDQPIRGEIRNVIDQGETPEGAKVKLKSGVTGFVKRVAPEE